ncbi:MAG: hypothetical protein PHY43_08210 [Verrucomicrobiales bacterium]|nr:hypothetical protein [Verrucomicrobiales bacterium]
MRNIQQKLSVARGEQRAELLFKNARVVNVFSGEIHRTHVAVEDGRIIGFGNYEAKKVSPINCWPSVPRELNLAPCHAVPFHQLPAPGALSWL